MLLGGKDDGAARGLHAAFAWAAPDIAQMTRPTAVLEAVADAVHWQGFGVVVLAKPSADADDLECLVVRAKPNHPAPLAPRWRITGTGAETLLAAAAENVRAHDAPWVSDDDREPWVCLPLRVRGTLTHLVVVLGDVFAAPTRAALTAFARFAEVTMNGIAEREKLIQELTRREAITRSAVASERFAVLGEAAAVLAHELRNPLCTIATAVALLDRPDAEGPSEKGVARAIIREEVARLDGLVSDLLHLARPLDPSRRRVELGNLVRTTLERARKQLNGTHVLVSPSPLEESVEVTGDPALLALALENLLRNAAQAAPPASEIRVEIAPRPADVTVSIEDDGPGVNVAMQERIFEPFFTTRAVGTGLGLSIVKRLVEAHGGSVKVGASRTGGARFDLVFARSR